MYKGCIFDLDGTLANTLDAIAAIGNSSLAALGLPAIHRDAYRYMVGNGADKLVHRMLARTKPGYSPGDAALLRKTYDGLYEEDPLRLVTPYPGMQDLVAQLRARGVKTAVLSNKPDDMTKATVYPLFGETAFDIVQGQLPRLPAKPDPTSVLELIDRLGLQKNETLYVGDTWVDMETGKNAGLATAGVLWGFRDEAELREHGARFLVPDAEALRALIFEEA